TAPFIVLGVFLTDVANAQNVRDSMERKMMLRDSVGAMAQRILDDPGMGAIDVDAAFEYLDGFRRSPGRDWNGSMPTPRFRGCRPMRWPALAAIADRRSRRAYFFVVANRNRSTPKPNRDLLSERISANRWGCITKYDYAPRCCRSRRSNRKRPGNRTSR